MLLVSCIALQVLMQVASIAWPDEAVLCVLRAPALRAVGPSTSKKKLAILLHIAVHSNGR